MRDYLLLAMRNLRHRPKRSWLTIIGILIGMAAVVALVSLGQGFQQAIDREFEGFGYNVIWIMGGGSFQYSWTSTFELDLTSLQQIDGVATAGAMLWKTPYVKTEKKYGSLASVAGRLTMPLATNPYAQNLLCRACGFEASGLGASPRLLAVG